MARRPDTDALRIALASIVGVCGCAVALAQPAPAGTHRVQPGETLWGISRQHLNTPLRWPDVQRGNEVASPQRLRPGQLLNLPTALRVAELTGLAWIKRGGQAQQPVSLGTSLQEGDVLVTDRNAFLSLVLADGSHVVMPSSTAMRVVVADGRQTRLELLEGRLESHIEKQNNRHFEIRTRSAGLGVRGTHFRVRDEGGVSTSEVLTGAVAAQSSADARLAPVLLEKARGAPLSGPQALQPRDLLPAPSRLPAAEAGQIRARPVEGAVRYRLQMARDERFYQLVHDAVAPEPVFTLPAALAAGFYATRLTAFDADLVEGLPGDDMLLVAAAAPHVRVTAQVLADGRVEIRWPTVPSMGEAQRFELALTSSFQTPVASESGALGEGVTVGPLGVPGIYHWRVRPHARGLQGAQPPHAGWAGTFEIPLR